MWSNYYGAVSFFWNTKLNLEITHYKNKIYWWKILLTNKIDKFANANNWWRGCYQTGG